MITGNEPAMPLDSMNVGHPETIGLTILQKFAESAMQGMLANPYFAAHAPREKVSDSSESLDYHLARRAVEVAQNLIKELNKTTTPCT